QRRRRIRQQALRSRSTSAIFNSSAWSGLESSTGVASRWAHGCGPAPETPDRVSRRAPLRAAPAGSPRGEPPHASRVPAPRYLAHVDHPSDSKEHSAAEPEVLALLGETLGVTLGPKTLTLPEGARVDVDGVGPDESVLVEVFAHQGRLKGGQVLKV